MSAIDVTNGTVVPGASFTLSRTIISVGGGPDWTLKTGYFWALGSHRLVRVDPTTGAVRRFAFPGAPYCGSYGAAWTYGNGNLGFSCNKTGKVLQVHLGNPTSATNPRPSRVAMNDGPSSTGNDGTATAALPADLGVVKHGPARFTRGHTITYTLKVTNNGRGASSGFVVSDSVPGRLSNVNSPDSACTTSGHDVTCIGGTLAVGASRSFTITAKTPTSGGCLTNEATVLGNEADPAAANDTSSTTACPRSPGAPASGTSGSNHYPTQADTGAY